jgi:hypothetical protein
MGHGEWSYAIDKGTPCSLLLVSRKMTAKHNDGHGSSQVTMNDSEAY